jgi:ketosteroid isomerase-like protein
MKKNMPVENKPSRRIAVAGLLALPFATAAAAAETPGSDEELLKVREAVWRDWFGGNRKALMEILPPDFVGIGAGDGPFRSRDETIADSAGFVAAGDKLTDLRFNDNRIQKLGNVRIIYCGFSFTTSDKAGGSRTTAGRCTEVFTHSGGKWLHPGWHLDSGR